MAHGHQESGLLKETQDHGRSETRSGPAEPVPRAWTAERMEAERVVRYADLVPCLNAFIDTRSPGSEAKENFTIIGPGVSENPDQYVHIAEPHGFNIGGARQPPGCVNSQHSHDTAEVFIVHRGRWRFNLGERGEDATVECNPGDVISLPTRMFRGFTCLPRYEGDREPGYLFAVLGGDDPGRVLWAPYVFDMAERFGLVLLANGDLVDTHAGDEVPSEIGRMPRTTAEQVASLDALTVQEAQALVARQAPSVSTCAAPVIGGGGPLPEVDGFTVEQLTIVAGTGMTVAPSETPQVLFVHEGRLSVSWDGGTLTLVPGDTMTVPSLLEVHIESDAGSIAFRVAGT